VVDCQVRRARHLTVWRFFVLGSRHDPNDRRSNSPPLAPFYITSVTVIVIG